MRLLFFLCILSYSAFAQKTIRGKIKDIRGKAVPLANVFSIKNQKGTVTNEKGEFELQNIYNNDTLKIENISFIPKLIAVKDFKNGNTITLSDSVKSLGDVVVRNFNAFKKLASLGYSSYEDHGEFKFVPGNQIAVYFKNPNRKEAWLKSVSFNIKDFGSCNTNFRIRLLKVDLQKSMPSTDIITEDIIVFHQDLKKKNTVNLSDYKIIFPKEGMFVDIEWLPSENNCKKSFASISANLEVPTNQIWLNYKDQQWSHLNRPRLPNGNFLTPNIGIEVAY